MTLTKKILGSVKGTADTFIETGSYIGGGIDAALQAGFADIRSIEFNDEWYAHCCRKYKDSPRVQLYHGESTDKLAEILSKLDVQALFWLDAHYDPKSQNPDQHVATNEPLIPELELIRGHHINTHVIMIDDRRMFDDDNPSWPNTREKDVLGKLWEINPGYTITYLDSLTFTKDIIVAKL